MFKLAMGVGGRSGTSTQTRLPWILIAAYDVSLGETSEGYVALNVLRIISKTYRVVLLTRRNNQQRLLASAAFRAACPGTRVLGFDLPRWAAWWKQGPRFYGLYAYLWQLCWPIALRSKQQLLRRIRCIHVLNFHNDSIASLAWILGRPVIWGPINHNEQVVAWRQTFWPAAVRFRHRMAFFLRRLAWRLDPLLYTTRKTATVILSAGPWVDRRLRIEGSNKVTRLSQLGVDDSLFSLGGGVRQQGIALSGHLLVFAGRLDWIKGVDLAIEALSKLPESFRLLLIGSGPAKADLLDLIDKLGLPARVEFRSPISRLELAEVYLHADLFLFTSAEAAGLAWIEALACGLPIVGFSGDTELTMLGPTFPGIFLVPAGADRESSIKAYVSAIAEAVTRPHERATIREATRRRYAWDRMAGVISGTYENEVVSVR